MRIAIYAFDGITMFHLAVPQMVFGEVSRQGLADWETVLFSDGPQTISTAEGYQLSFLNTPESVVDADVVVIPSWHEDLRSSPDELREVIADAHGQGAQIIGLCLGAIPLAQSGVLQGRTAVTHWHAFDALTKQAGETSWDDSVLYLDHGDVLTSAGTAAGLDACLHFVRTRLGSDAALQVSRSLVIAPHRAGGQAQFVERPITPTPENAPIAAVLDWIDHHLEDKLTIAELSEVAHMSTRTFSRAFKDATGTSPAAWVRTRRLDEARRLLELTDLPVEQIAHRVGFGGTATLRQNFAAAFGLPPSNYRERFHHSD